MAPLCGQGGTPLPPPTHRVDPSQAFPFCPVAGRVVRWPLRGPGGRRKTASVPPKGGCGGAALSLSFLLSLIGSCFFFAATATPQHHTTAVPRSGGLYLPNHPPSVRLSLLQPSALPTAAGGFQIEGPFPPPQLLTFPLPLGFAAASDVVAPLKALGSFQRLLHQWRAAGGWMYLSLNQLLRDRNWGCAPIAAFQSLCYWPPCKPL